MLNIPEAILKKLQVYKSAIISAHGQEVFDVAVAGNLDPILVRFLVTTPSKPLPPALQARFHTTRLGRG